MPAHIFKQRIITAFKHNLIPGLILQTFAIAIALCFFYWPASHILFDSLSEIKSQYGWKYALVSTAIFGGLIPFFYLYFSGQVKQSALAVIVFFTVFWGLKGVELNLFYLFQGWLFGYELNTSTIAKKVIFDQLLYGPIWAVPTLTLAYAWKDAEFKLNGITRLLNKEFFTLRLPVMIITNWLVWIPAVTVIYIMPPLLQIPVSNLILCFFVLIITALHPQPPKQDYPSKHQPSA